MRISMTTTPTIHRASNLASSARASHRNSSSWCSRAGYFVTAEPPERSGGGKRSKSAYGSAETAEPNASRRDSSVAAVLSTCQGIWTLTFRRKKRAKAKLRRRGVLPFRMSDWDKGVWGHFPTERWVAHGTSSQMESFSSFWPGQRSDISPCRPFSFCWLCVLFCKWGDYMLSSVAS